MSRTYVRDNVPLSRFGVLVAQLESIVASASQKPPDPLLCFDILSDLISAIDEEPKESILLWQRKCEDALYSLLTLGARRPVRHLASVAMAIIISKGDSISIYSRASTLQGFLSDGKRIEPQKFAGAAQCLGELYRRFGRRITSGLLETTMIVAKLMKFNEEFVRQVALNLLQNALEGCGGTAASSAYSDSYRLITRFGIVDKSPVVRIAAARCLKAFANIGGPGLGISELDNSASNCVKACALEDPISSVRDAFSEALGSLLALGMNPEAQVQPRGKGPFPPPKKLEGGLQRHLTLPFNKASGARSKEVRIGLTFSWVFFLQAIRLKYLRPDTELQNFAFEAMEMLHVDASVDAYALACVLYILRVGVTDQMTEPTQRSFLIFLGKQVQSSDGSPFMKIAALRTFSYTLKTLGEVPNEFKEELHNTIAAAVFHHSQLVRIEAALMVRVLAEADPTCVGGLISFVMTTLNASRENVAFEKGSNLKVELDSLHGQAITLAALVSISPKLPLGYPARFPRSVLEVSKKMLTESSRNPVAALSEKEAGWLLLSSLLASMPKEELEDQVFDILSLWAGIFGGNVENEIKQAGDLESRVSMWSAAIDALTCFVRCFISLGSTNNGVLLQPVIVYLSRALSYISLLSFKGQPSLKSCIDLLIIRTLMAYQSLPDPMAYKHDHPQILQLCATPFREPVGFEESSSLRLLLDKRDAWVGPWIPGRDWLEDELRAFQGGKDGLMPCVWEDEYSSFPQPATINKTLVNQMLLCFGTMFACQDSGGMLSLLGVIEQCLKAGKKQIWHTACVTNICVGLLAGLKNLLALRSHPLGVEILNSVQGIFQGILVEGDICASQRRASAEGLGLLARLGTDVFTARMTRLFLADLTSTVDSNYAGSIALALGCIHRSAGGMALSSLVPATVNSISLLAKSSIVGLQTWSLHGLLLTIEAAGLSYVSQVQATLGLALDILLSEENGWVELQQCVGRLINAIVAVLGPELAPGSIFFSRCKSVVAEICSRHETATMLESIRFTQQLVLVAPQAVSVHTHVQTLLLTLSSRQPILRHLAVSTLRHLIEKDPVSVIAEKIEANLFHMLDEETDSEYVVLRVLATPARNAENGQNSENDATGPDGDSGLNLGNDDETMVSTPEGTPHASEAFSSNPSREKHLRYRTRVFAAECLSNLPTAVGANAAHFDLHLARKQSTAGKVVGDWLVLHVQELISLAYQISTIQFESMRPIGVGLLSAIVDKFEAASDPELPGHLLIEQYQAQLVSAVRTALDMSSGPVLLEAGLHLATKIMTSGIISGDQVAVKRIFSLISNPLNDFNGLYYPSFAEWVSSKIKIRLLAAHASLKCYTYASLRRHQSGVPDEYMALLPLFSKSSSVLGKYWINVLKDYSYICLHLNHKKNWNIFLDGIQSPLVSSKLQPCLEEAWPVILQAVALDAVPVNLDQSSSESEVPGENTSRSLISGYSMVELQSEEYRFLWGFALLVLFESIHPTPGKVVIPLGSKDNNVGDSLVSETSPQVFKSYEIVLPVFQFLSTERFFCAGFLTADICQELLQIFSYSLNMDNSWNSLAISVLSQILQKCPDDFLEDENFAYLMVEVCLAHLINFFGSFDAISSDQATWEDLISSLFITAKALVKRFEMKMQKQLKSVLLAFLLIGYKCLREASTELCFMKVCDFVKCTSPLLKKLVGETYALGDDGKCQHEAVLGTYLNVITDLSTNCINNIHKSENKKSEQRKLLHSKLAFSLEQTILLAKVAWEIECVEDGNPSSICFAVFKYCTKCVQAALSDSDIQVQAIGLQVIKSMFQRESPLEGSIFLEFFIGELIQDIFTMLQKQFEMPLTKGSVTIAGECLSILMLLQTSSKSSECQRNFMNLLLEAVVLVFSGCGNGPPQESDDIRNIAMRLVSHLAQIPSSADHLKNSLLSMPASHRLQLQGIIRASVTQDHNTAQMKPTTPSLGIKLPLPVPAEVSKPSGQTGGKDIPSYKQEEEEEEEEDDDWDTFQSFPTSSAAKEVDEEYSPIENTENDDFGEFSASSENKYEQEGSPTHGKEVNEEYSPIESSVVSKTNREDGDFGECSASSENIYEQEGSPTHGKESVELNNDSQTDATVIDHSDDDHSDDDQVQKRQAETMSSQESEKEEKVDD
ncbi:hypothetical protein ACFE04_009383 [Oxalis oulophora]